MAGGSGILPRLWRAKWVGLVVFAICVTATAGYIGTIKRLYRSEAVLAWRAAPVAVPGAGGAGGPGLPATSTTPALLAVDGMTLLASRARLEEVINEMGLYRELRHGPGGLADAVAELRRHLDVTVVGEGGVHLRFDGETREEAQGVLTRLVDRAVSEQAARRRASQEGQERGREAALDEARKALEKREADLKAFEERGATAPPPSEAAPPAPTPAPRPLDTAQLANLQRREAELEERAAEAEKESTAAPVPRAIHEVDPALAGARSAAQDEVAVARQLLADRRVQFTDEHPDVKAAMARLDQAKEKLKVAEAALTAARAAAEQRSNDDVVAAAAAVAAQERAAELKRELAGVRSLIAGLKSRAAPRPVEKPVAAPAAVDQGERLRLTAAVAEARDKLRDLESAPVPTPAPVAAGPELNGDLILVAPATQPGRAREGERREIALLGGGGAIVLALVGMIVGALLDRRLYNRRDVARVAGPDVIVVVTRLTGKSV